MLPLNDCHTIPDIEFFLSTNILCFVSIDAEQPIRLSVTLCNMLYLVTLILLAPCCRCATEEYVEILPLSQQRLGIRWKAFSFINHPLLNLECKTIVCLKSEVTKDCDRSCDSAKPDVRRRRRKRDAVRTVRDVYWIQSPPFVLTEPRVHPSGETMTPYDALGRNTTEHCK